MKSIVLGLGIAATAFSGVATAQSPILPPAPPATTDVPRQYVRRPVTDAEQLIFERAVVRAREREARMEVRRWTGQSMQRPNVRIGHYSSDLNQHIWNPGYGYYTGPVVFGHAVSPY